MPTPLHPHGWQCPREGLTLHWGTGGEILQGRGGLGVGGTTTGFLQPCRPPCTPYPNTNPPGHETDATSQSLIGAARATSLTPRHTTLIPLPKTTHGKGGGGEWLRTLPIPQTHTPHPEQDRDTAKAHSKALAPLFWRAQRGWGGLGWAGRVRARDRVFQPKCWRETLLRPSWEEDPPLPPQQALRLWGVNRAGGVQGGEGAARCSLTGARLGPAAPVLPRVLVGKGGAVLCCWRAEGWLGTPCVGGRRGMEGPCIGCIVLGVCA